MEYRPNLLIIDDEPAICELLSYEFSNHSFDVSLAHSYEDAMREFSKKKPDVVICDLHLSGQSGPSILKEVKKKHQDIPFIFITGGTDFTIVDAYRCGADDFFVKPFKRSEIVKSVYSKIERKMILDLPPLPSQNIPFFGLDIGSPDLIPHAPQLLIGRLGVYVFTKDDLPKVDTMIQLNLQNEIRIFAMLIGKVRFTHSETDRGYGLEIHYIGGEKSLEIENHLSRASNCLAIPLPPSIA